jgi:hypothetical protein
MVYQLRYLYICINGRGLFLGAFVAGLGVFVVFVRCRTVFYGVLRKGAASQMENFEIGQLAVFSRLNPFYGRRKGN